MQKFTLEEKEKWNNIIEKSKNELLEIQKTEREELQKTIKSKTTSKEERKKAKKQIKELDEIVKQETRQKAKEIFNYPIFMCEADNVGITSTGEIDEEGNELPEILKQYLKFRKNPDIFIRKIELENKENK